MRGRNFAIGRGQPANRGTNAMSGLSSDTPMRTVLALAALSFLLSGCGGVQLEGKVFDVVGLTGKKEQAEKQVPDRAPLVLPPTRKLPAPGSRDRVTNQQNWPQDPNIVTARQAEEKKKHHAKTCAENDFKQTASVEFFNEFHTPTKHCKTLVGTGELDAKHRGDATPQEHTSEVGNDSKQR